MKISLLVLLLISSIVFAKDILVMQIDTGVDTSHFFIKEHLIQTEGYEYIDNHGHGTHIAGLILKNVCPQVKLISCKVFDVVRFDERIYMVPAKKSTVDCFQEAIDLKVNYVNFSGGGNSIILKERVLMKTLTESGTVIVTAAGNDNSNSQRYYPAGYNLPGVIVVGNLNKDGKRYEGKSGSNYGFPNMVWEIGTDVLSTYPNGKFDTMTGTSQATAVHLNRLLRAKCLKLKQ